MTNKFIRPNCIKFTSSWAITILVWLGVSSCSQKPYLQTTLDEYGQRTANILEMSWQETERINKTDDTQPLSVSGQQKTNNTFIKLNEFYQLPDCGIKPIIAERNTTMGKLQAPSQRYLYDIRLLQALEQCQLKDDEATKEQLSSLIQQKRYDAQQSWLVLLRRSPELTQAIWNNRVHFAADEEHRHAIQSWLSLSKLSPNSDLKNISSNSVELEKSLELIEKFKTPAKIKNDILLITHYLPPITDFIDRESRQLACETHPGDKQKVEYLRNVFNLFFIQKIQVHIAKVNAWYYQIEPILSQLPLTEDNAKTWLNKESHEAFLAQIKAHVAVWQDLFKRCNMSPASV